MVGFVRNCLTQQIDSQSTKAINSLIQKLKGNHDILAVTDFGAGSKKLSNNRKVKDILATSTTRGKYGNLLFQMARFYQPKNVLELGTSLGIGAIHLKMGNPNSHVTTIEACPNTFNQAAQNFKEVHLEVEQFNSTFSDFFEGINNSELKYDLVFIDGHHDGEAVLNYLGHLKNHSHNETIYIIDDIRWSASMKKAWDTIVTDPDFHVTIDLFRMGIASRSHQHMKEHVVVHF